MLIYHIDMVILDIDMEYGLMIWEMTISDTVISHINMGYLVTLAPPWRRCSTRRGTRSQGLTLVHFSAQPEPFLAQKHPTHTLIPPCDPHAPPE